MGPDNSPAAQLQQVREEARARQMQSTHPQGTDPETPAQRKVRIGWLQEWTP